VAKIAEPIRRPKWLSLLNFRSPFDIFAFIVLRRLISTFMDLRYCRPRCYFSSFAVSVCPQSIQPFLDETSIIMTILADTITKNTRRSLTPWELPSLLTPVHNYRRSKQKAGPERPHFPAILGFVYRNRFAVASQIRRRFADVLKSDRTARRHLEELEVLGYLGLAPTSGLSPLFPKVYYVTGRGVKKLQTSLATQEKPWKAARVDRCGRHSQEGYSADRIIHELLITEFLLGIQQTIVGRSDLELLTIQRRSLAKHPAFRLAINGRRTRLIPDAMFLFRQTGGGMICCFVEMDNGTMNRKQIRAKYARYLAWSQFAAGQQYLLDLYRRHGAVDPRPVFRLLVIARSRTGKDDQRRMQELCAPAAKLPATLRDRLWFTTVDELCQWQHNPRPLEMAMWRKGHGMFDPENRSANTKQPAIGSRCLAYSLFPNPTDTR
jgi:hypothetical protein